MLNRSRGVTDFVFSSDTQSQSFRVDSFDAVPYDIL